jgi:hypothetical protein
MVADRLKALTVRVSSPDSHIQGVLNGRSVRIRFRPGSYEDYREDVLAHQISRLLTLMATGYRRGHGQVMKDADLVSVTDPAKADGPKQRRYLTEVNELVVLGRTARGLVRIRCVGMRDWQCRIAPGTVKGLTEEQFVAELEAAIQRLLSNYKHEIVFLKDRCYDLEIPIVRQARERREREGG